MKFCKDCKHYTVKETETIGEVLCRATAFEPVYGQPLAPTNCYAERGRNGLCGPLGALWEPIEVTPLNETNAEIASVPAEAPKPARKPRTPKVTQEETTSE